MVATCACNCPWLHRAAGVGTFPATSPCVLLLCNNRAMSLMPPTPRRVLVTLKQRQCFEQLKGSAKLPASLKRLQLFDPSMLSCQCYLQQHTQSSAIFDKRDTYLCYTRQARLWSHSTSLRRPPEPPNTPHHNLKQGFEKHHAVCRCAPADARARQQRSTNTRCCASAHTAHSPSQRKARGCFKCKSQPTQTQQTTHCKMMVRGCVSVYGSE